MTSLSSNSNTGIQSSADHIHINQHSENIQLFE